MNSLETFLLSSPMALLTLVAAVGFLVGGIRFPGGFRLGTAAVMFAGMGFGVWNPKFALPTELQLLGLMTFVFCLGLEAGPSFVRSLKRDGIRISVCAVGAIGLVALVLWGCIRWLPGAETWPGVFCGALHNTPALGAATEATIARGGSAAEAARVGLGYGIVYPFALVTLLLLCQWRMRGSPVFSADQGRSSAETPPPVTIEIAREHSPGVPWSAGEIMAQTGLVLSTISYPSGQRSVVSQTTPLVLGAKVIAVGTPEQQEKGAALLGTLAQQPLHSLAIGFQMRRYVVSNRAIAGIVLRDLQERLGKEGAVLTRIRRGDVELPVQADLHVELGDRVRIVSQPETESRVRALLGDSLHELTEGGYLSLALGIFLGLVAGSVGIPAPGLSTPLKLGAAGGPLILGLLLGWLRRTGPFVWGLPLDTSLTLRSAGLILFFATVGTRAGAGLAEVINLQGLLLVATGCALVVLTHMVFWNLLRWTGIRDAATLLGYACGLQTQPAAFTFVGQRQPPASFAIAYASIYPLATLIKILFAQALAIAVL